MDEPFLDELFDGGGEENGVLVDWTLTEKGRAERKPETEADEAGDED